MWWLPNSDISIERRLLRILGLEDIDPLFSDIPQSLIKKKPPDLPSYDEIEVEQVFRRIISENCCLGEWKFFLGGGCWFHYVPAVIDEVSSKQEFYTSYTPYQAEISQGALQAIFEYQSLMAELLEMDVVNASHYDWSTALAEAALMTMRITKRKEILVPENMHPERLEVLRTYLFGAGGRIRTYSFDKKRGTVLLDSLDPNSDTAMVYLENPNFFGVVEDEAEAVGEKAHSKGALYVMGVDPLSLGILKPPGECGADIAVGEGQHLGSYPSFGGPSLGIMAAKWDLRLVRQMPGRLIGMTWSKSGVRGYVMTLQTREQHIRQERATSNITTNESLMAIRAAVYLSLMGAEGLRNICMKIIGNTQYLIEEIGSLDKFESPVFDQVHFREFLVRSSLDWDVVNSQLRSMKIIGGLPLSRFGEKFRELGNSALFCTTEIHSKDDLDLLVHALRRVS